MQITVWAPMPSSAGELLLQQNGPNEITLKHGKAQVPQGSFTHMESQLLLGRPAPQTKRVLLEKPFPRVTWPHNTPAQGKARVLPRVPSKNNF